MSVTNIPTPDNIVSITYQLLQQSGDPASVRAQLPILTIQFQDNNSVLRNKIVGFNEMLPYLRYLKAKADSIPGKAIVCNPPSTYDQKIVFLIGEAEPFPPVFGTVNFKVNGVDFTAPNVLTNIINASGASDATRDFNNTPFILTFQLPSFTTRFADDYTQSDDMGGLYFITASGGGFGGTWFVTIIPYPAANGNYHFDFTPIAPITTTFQVNGVDFDDTNALDTISSFALTNNHLVTLVNNTLGGVQFTLPKFTDNFDDDYFINTPFGTIYFETIAIGDKWQVYLFFGMAGLNAIVDCILQPIIQVVNNSDNSLYLQTDIFQVVSDNDTKYIKRQNFEIRQFGKILNNGSQTVLQYEGASLVEEDYALPIDADINLFSGNVTRIVINNVYVQVKNDDTHQVIVGYNGDLSPNAQGSYATIIDGASSDATRFIKSPSAGSNLYVLGVPTLDGVAEFVTLYKKGVQIFTQALSMSGITSAAIGGFEDFDAINIGAAPAPPVLPLQARYTAGSPAGICNTAPQTVYTSDGAITNGEVAYTNIAGTIPLAGFDFIVDTTTGVIHSINNVTGIIGLSIGSSCIPPAGKNVFFINVSGDPANIDIDGTPYNIANGASQNVVVFAESVLTNNGNGHTYTMYQSLPPIPANITPGSGTPVVIPNLGTYNFPIDITNYNYIRVTP